MRVLKLWIDTPSEGHKLQDPPGRVQTGANALGHVTVAAAAHDWISLMPSSGKKGRLRDVIGQFPQQTGTEMDGRQPEDTGIQRGSLVKCICEKASCKCRQRDS